MKTPLFTASSIAELGSATLILDSERRHIAEANSGQDAAFIVRARNSHAQLVGLAELAAKREPEMMDKAEMRAVLVNLYEMARAALQSAKE